MNCQECRDELAAYIEGLLDETQRNQMEAHMAECSNCQRELQEVRELMARLAREAIAAPPVSLENAVMERIISEQALQIRRLKMRRRIRSAGDRWGAGHRGPYPRRQPLAYPVGRSAKGGGGHDAGRRSRPNFRTIHIVGKMRTAPHDNFSYVNAKVDFVPVEVWRQSTDKSRFPKWRVEKPGRVVVMDGKSTTMLIRPDLATTIPYATWGAFDTGWVLGLSSVPDMIASELRFAHLLRWDLKATEAATGAGEQKRLVTVEARTWLPANDIMKNVFFEFSDMRRVYRFDAKTDRLEGMEAYLHQPGGDVLVWTIERIEYGRPIDPSVFALKLPKSVRWSKEPKPLPGNEKYEKMTPEQAARAFFEACAKEDWAEVEKLRPRPLASIPSSTSEDCSLTVLGRPFSQPFRSSTAIGSFPMKSSSRTERSRSGTWP